MRAKSVSWYAAIGLVLAGVMATSTARADVRTDARRHFRTGMAMIAEGQVDEGIAELLEAYEILPHPNVLYNIGRAYAESGSYEEAVDYFERYLASDPPDRSEVQGFLDAINARLAALAEGQEQEAEPAQTAQPTQTTTQAAAPLASEDDIAALEDSATQIDALAESTQSDALRQRATRLRELAASLREGRTQPQVVQTPETGQTGQTGQTGETGETGETAATGEQPELVLGDERQGDTYEETVVSSSRAAESPLDAPNATSIVTSQDVRMSGYWNIGENIRRVPGVDLMVTSPGNVQFSVRGLNQRLNNRAIVLVDGRSVYLDFVGGQLWSMIPLNPEDIERIEVIRGPASALYGADALTGVVNILTRQLGEGRSYVTAGVGTHGQYRVAAGVTERVDRVRFRLSGGYETADAYSRSVGPNRVDVEPFFEDNPDIGYTRQMFNGEAEVRLGEGYSIRGGAGLTTGSSVFQGISRLRDVGLRDALFSQTYLQVNTGFGLSGRAFWNRFSATHGPPGIRQNGLTQAEDVAIPRQDVIDVELIYTNSFTIVDGIDNQVIAGIGYRFKELDWDWTVPVEGDGRVQTQNHGNIFLQDTLSIEEVVQIVVSARGDLHPLLGPQVSPRGSVVVHPTPRQSIRLSAGTAFRSPTFIESYANVPNPTPLRGVTAFGIGNEELNPERIVSVELGYMLQEFDFFAFELTGYYNLVFDQILLSRNTAYRLWDFQNTPRAIYDPDLAAFALGELVFDNEDADFQQLGGEVGVRVFPVTGLDIWANYAIHETTTIGDAQTLEGRELDQRTSVHKINAGVQYRAPFGLELSVDFHWVSDQVWVEQVLDTERGGTAFVPFELPSYALMNARIGWRFLDDQVELSVVGSNLLMEHRQHPFAQRIDRRFMGNVAFRW